MPTSIKASVTGIAAVIVFSSTAIAQAPAGAPSTQPAGTSAPASKQTTSPAKTSLPAADRDFMMKAAQSDIAEIQGGQAAKDKAASDAVRKFADQMVRDHTKTSEQLKGMAQSRSVSVPTTPSAKDQQEMKKMSGMSGADFDRAYMASQVRAHRDAVALFEKQAKSGKDAELKAFASSTLPALQDHLKMATDIAKSTSQSRGKEPAPKK